MRRGGRDEAADVDAADDASARALRCASCGSREDLLEQACSEIHFCSECRRRARGPRKLGDELYFTLGGGD